VDQSDAVSIMRLQEGIQVPLGEKSDVIAAFARVWPTLRCENLDSEPVFGRFTTRGYTADVTFNFRRGFCGASIEAVPEGRYFDEALLTGIEQLCETNGWLSVFTNSAEDRFL
jgi:hypothetical protein